jgi:hypothetical protein
MIRRVFLIAIAGSALLPLLAWAGPNAGGTIIAHDASFVVETDYSTFCGLGTAPPSCEGADVDLEGSSSLAQKLWKVYAAFPQGSSPRLKAMTFGIHWDPQNVLISIYAPCIGDQNNGALEIAGPGWPGNDTGTAIVFQFTQTTELVECYYFVGYNYYGVPSLFQLRDHPDPVLGGKFADDSVPAIQDPIAGYGSMGFDTPGQVACPPPNHHPGACCLCGGECVFVLPEECAGMNGTFMGDGIPCDPNPCPVEFMGACCYPDGHCEFVFLCDCPTGVWYAEDACDPNPCEPPNPTRTTTWGGIKAIFH